jgi:twitching motility protein PilT
MEKYLKQMSEKKASDLLLVAGSPLIYKIAGTLIYENNPLSAQEISALLLPLLSALQKDRLEKERQLDFAYAISSGERFRINIHYQKASLAAAIRLVSKQVPLRADLSLPDVIEDLCELKNGLVIVTGPTGSGKTTTQACMVEMINAKRAAHIITVEDPVEYVFENKKSVIEQREVGQDVLSFADGLRAALRQNPDVILIGEMRDLETTATAITAAETGHLVISTLHTSSAVNAIDRIIDIFPSGQQNQVRIQLALTLQAVVAQQLIPVKDNNSLALGLEILRGIPAIRNLIRKSQTHEVQTLMEVNRKYGMQTMEDSLLSLVKNNKIQLDQALSRVIDPDSFKKRI